MDETKPRQDDETPAPLAESGSEAPEAQGGAEAVAFRAQDRQAMREGLERDRARVDELASRYCEPAAAQPHPTDAPGRRDWAGEIAEILRPFAIGGGYSGGLWASDLANAADRIVAALRLDELGEEFAAMAAAMQRLDEHNGEIGSPGQAVAWVLRDLEEARKERDAARLAHDNAKWLIDGQNQEIEYLRNRVAKPGCAQAHEDLAEAAGKLDALRVGIGKLADQLRERKLIPSTKAIPAELWWTNNPAGVERELRALLEPPTTTPDGTGTADLLPGCPVEVWDGPYQYRCAMGGNGNVCAQHGPFTPALRCAVTPGCRRPERHGGRCNPLTDGTGTAEDGSEGGGK